MAEEIITNQKVQYRKKCILCNSDRTLGKGHIIPSWAFSLADGLDGKIATYSYDPKEKVNIASSHRSTLSITEKMLCITPKGKNSPVGCEQILGFAEEELKKVLIDGLKITERIGTFPYMKIKVENYALVSQAILGIIYKAFISKKFFLTEHFQNESPLVPLLIKSIQDTNIAKNILKIFVVKFYDEETHNNSPANYMNIFSLENDDVKSNMFLLSFAGVCIVAKIEEESQTEQEYIEIFAHSFRNSGHLMGGLPNFIVPCYVNYTNNENFAIEEVLKFVFGSRGGSIVNNLVYSFSKSADIESALRLANENIKNNIAIGSIKELEELEKVSLEVKACLEKIQKFIPKEEEEFLNSLLIFSEINDLSPDEDFFKQNDLFFKLKDIETHNIFLLEVEALVQIFSSLKQTPYSCVCKQKNRSFQACCGQFWDIKIP